MEASRTGERVDRIVRRVAQLQANLASLDLELTRDQVTVLDEASSIDLGFPYEQYQRERIVTFVYGGMRDRILRG